MIKYFTNDVKKCVNPSTLEGGKITEIICFAPGKLFINGRLTTLIQNHALWLGLFVFLIIFAIHFHPIFLIKKVPKPNLKLKIYVPSQTHKVNFLFLWLSCEKCQNNYAEWKAWFTTIYRKYFKGSYLFGRRWDQKRLNPYTRCSTLAQKMVKKGCWNMFRKRPTFIVIQYFGIFRFSNNEMSNLCLKVNWNIHENISQWMFLECFFMIWQRSFINLKPYIKYLNHKEKIF